MCISLRLLAVVLWERGGFLGLHGMRTSVIDFAENSTDSQVGHQAAHAAPQSGLTDAVSAQPSLPISPSARLQAGRLSLAEVRGQAGEMLQHIVPTHDSTLMQHPDTVYGIGCFLGMLTMILCCLAVWSVAFKEWMSPVISQTPDIKAQLPPQRIADLQHESMEAYLSAQQQEHTASRVVATEKQCSQEPTMTPASDDEKVVQALPTVDDDDVAVVSSLDSFGEDEDDGESSLDDFGVVKSSTDKMCEVLRRASAEPTSESAQEIQRVLTREMEKGGKGAEVAKKLEEVVKPRNEVMASVSTADSNGVSKRKFKSSGGHDREIDELLRGASGELRSLLVKMHTTEFAEAARRRSRQSNS